MRLAGTKLAANHQYRGFGDQLYDLAGERPSLDLNFANTKTLTDSATSTTPVTFTRASSGTYVDSQGVIRTATTNLLLRSEELATSPWFNAGVTLTNNSTDVLDPFGGTKSTKIVATGSSSAVGQGATIATASTGSIWLRTSSGTASFSLIIYLSSSPFTNIGTANITVTTAWQRFSVTSSTPPAQASYNFQLQAIPAATLYAFGAQLEQSSTVGEYIPTTSTINSAPRFDHNPTTGESLGLLVEEARTNLSQQSENFSDVYWAKTDCTITSNESTAPDGTLTADLWTNTASPGIVQTSIAKDATTRIYTGSLWVKGDSTAFTMSIDDGSTANRGRSIFNLSTGILTSILNSGTFTNTSGTITAYANGWYRLTVTTTTSTGTTIRLRPFFSNVGATVRIWGAQVEEGAFPTSYIPTTTAAVTRSADVASITGSNFSSWYRQDEGTVFSSATATSLTNSDSIGTAVGIAAFTDGTNAERIRHGALTFSTVWIDNNASQANLSSGTFTQNQQINLASAFKINDFALVRDGGSAQSDATGTLPTLTQVEFGRSGANTGFFTGTIRRLTYWPQRLPNSTLQRITQ